MSDYLWDKSGEPDPAIERLEDLLAAKRYEREPLRLPPVVPVQAMHAARPRPVYLQVAALAAGIVLAIIVGVWMHGRHESGSTKNVLVTAGDARREALNEDTGRAFAPTARVPEDDAERRSTGEAVSLEERRARRRMREPLIPAGRAGQSAKMSADQPLGIARLARKSRITSPDGGRLSVGVGGASEPEVVAQLHDEQRLAKEQLMLAMRMTSAKLNVARDKTRAAHVPEGGIR